MKQHSLERHDAEGVERILKSTIVLGEFSIPTSIIYENTSGYQVGYEA